MQRAFALALLTACASQSASALIPLSGTLETAAPATATTTDTMPVLPPVKLKAVLSLPRSADTDLSVNLSLTNLGPSSALLVASRDSRQDCAFGPLLRVLRVGSREVVYPAAQSPKICTQDALNTDLGKDQSLTLTHKLQLDPGEYMVEGWFTGGVNGVAQKIDAEPVRLTVR